MKQADFDARANKIRTIYNECKKLAEVPNIQKYTFIDRVVHETEEMDKLMAGFMWFTLEQETPK